MYTRLDEKDIRRQTGGGPMSLTLFNDRHCLWGSLSGSILKGESRLLMLLAHEFREDSFHFDGIIAGRNNYLVAEVRVSLIFEISTTLVRARTKVASCNLHLIR
ncbi:hypothetical protein ANTQUA_LOCUS3069 [Anthophora quadrimaculata]